MGSEEAARPAPPGVAAPGPRPARVLVVDGHGAFGMDPAVARAVPLTDEQWLALDAGPAMPSESARRMIERPARQPVFLRWPGRRPEWFDHELGTWVAVDAESLRAVVAGRARERSRGSTAPVGSDAGVATDPAAPAPASTPGLAPVSTSAGPTDSTRTTTHGTVSTSAATPTAPPAPGAALIGAAADGTAGERAPGDRRWPVWPVEYHERPQPNLALGLVLAAAAAHQELVERYDLRPLGSARPSTIDRVHTEATGVLLFSHYVWSTRGNLRMSTAAKVANPRFVTVHGGPNAPGYPDDVERFFADNPHVDVVVHGEGEATIVDLLGALATASAPDRDDPARLTCLDGVAGLSYRAADGSVVRGPKRKRLVDLDVVPSPYLTGVFDHLAMAGTLAVVETNRGCPFGCTFCDWGSATRSKVRTYDLERVVAELEWLAAAGVDGIFVADANFGALDRDLPIAEAIAAAKGRHGGPRQVMFTFAKDTAELLIPIVDLLWDAGVDVDGNLALQTVDEPTLRIVRRKNLPQPEYERVRQQFRDRNLPLTSDIMLGLPGSTFESMRQDVQFCIEHEITPRAHRTVLLPNAPMSAPQHRSEHGIVADAQQRTIAGATFSEEDLRQIGNLHRLADAWDSYGIARLPLRWAARDHGLPEIDVLERIDRLTKEDPDRFPAISWAAVGFTAWLVPPGTWEAFLAELGEWLVVDCGLPDDSALEAVLAAQAAVLPAPGARFPRRVDLAHDVAAWWASHAGRGGVTSPDRTPPLATFPPSTLVVDDGGRNDALLTVNRQSRSHSGRALREVRRIYAPSWELDQPMARPRMLDVEQHAFRFAE